MSGSWLFIQLRAYQTQGFQLSTGIPVHSVAGIREMVEFLYEARVPVKVEGRFAPISEKTKQEFDQYLKTYGVE